jgi:hypothetical protein
MTRSRKIDVDGQQYRYAIGRLGSGVYIQNEANRYFYVDSHTLTGLNPDLNHDFTPWITPELIKDYIQEHLQ